MSEGAQSRLFSSASDVGLMRLLLADLHDDLAGKIARFHQLSDLAAVLGSSGTMMPAGETTHAMWVEARSSFINGNYIATVMLCQSLAEHLLAAHLSIGLDSERLPARIAFNETLNRCLAEDVISPDDAQDLKKLMALRNPLAHFRNVDDPSGLSQRVMDTMKAAQTHLLNDASYAIGMAVRLLGLPAFRLGD